MKLDLNELKKRLKARSALAVTIESGRIAVNLVRNDEEDNRPVQALAIPLGDEAILRDPDKAGQQLAAALTAAGIRERNCVVCVPAGWALTASTDLPEIGAGDMRAYLELRAEREFVMPAGDLRLGFCAYDLPNGQRRATLAALSAKKIEAVEKMLAISNRRATSLSLALDNCFTPSGAMLHFLTNGNHTDLVVTAGGGIAGLRSLPGPLASGDTAFDPAAFCRDVRITLGRLPDTVRQQIREAAFSGPSAEKLCLETRRDLLRMGIESPECDYARASAPQAEPAGAAVETARLKLHQQAIPFEFLVPETKRWQVLLQQVDVSRRRWIIIAAAAVIVLPILLFIIRSQIEGHLDKQWNAMADKASDLGDLEDKMHQFRPWFEPAPPAMQLIDSVVNSFPATGEVWAKSIQVSEGNKVTCSVFARSQQAFFALEARMRARPDITAVQVLQMHGGNPLQYSFTFQWEPQHD